jgi:DNA-binding transcriptional MerR regulator
MKPLQALALEDPHWSLEELVQVANEQLPQFLPEEKAHTRVREDVTPRLIRHYASQRMLDEPLKEGREARYLYRHLLQLLLVRRLLAEGYGASAIDKLAISKTNQELEELLQGGVQLTITPANLALAFLQQVQQRQTPPMQSLPSLPSTPPAPVAPVPVAALGAGTTLLYAVDKSGSVTWLRTSYSTQFCLPQQWARATKPVATDSPNSVYLRPQTESLKMTLPQIEFLPLRPVVCSDRATTLDVLLRITPPQLEVKQTRPSLNLGFVIDRSGSMGGKKIDYARQAVCYAIEQLLASDRISITIFDDQVQPLVANTTANNKASLLRLVQQVQPGGSTALHGGWVQGSIQTSHNLSAQLNRVILLSDGLANVGETNPDTIASDVHGLAKRGVSTSTMGVGDDYDEDLLTAMAPVAMATTTTLPHPNSCPPFLNKSYRDWQLPSARSFA